MLPRLLLAAAFLAAAAACAPRPPGAAAPAPSAKPMYEPISAEELARVRDPHGHAGKPLCQRCHALTGEIVGDPNALCSGCHRFSMHNHPVDVVQKTAVVGLPLRAGNKVACHTCHDPHQKQKVLRKPFNELCTTCHPRH